MYAASFGLVIVALITLIIGVFQSGLTFIWISIASSVAAALFLAVGVLQKKPVQPATAGAPYGPPAGTAEAVDERETAVIEAPAPARRRVTAPPSRDEEEETAPPAPSREKAAPRKKAPAKRAPAKKAAAKAAPKSTASKGAAKKSSAKAAATGGTVVAIPERGTYHQASCRFVKGRRDTEKMTKASAGRKGFTPCGVCRP